VAHQLIEAMEMNTKISLQEWRHPKAHCVFNINKEVPLTIVGVDPKEWKLLFLRLRGQFCEVPKIWGVPKILRYPTM
jgi:hypothetical protein